MHHLSVFIQRISAKSSFFCLGWVFLSLSQVRMTALKLCLGTSKIGNNALNLMPRLCGDYKHDF